MALTRTTADSVLKEFYLPGIRNTLNNTIFLLSQITPNSEDIEGRRAVLSINTERNQGIGARAEMGILPAAGQQGYSEERVALKYNYGRIMISGPVMRSMGSDRGSFTRALQSETTGVTRDLKNDVNRQLYGTSDGVIATLAAGTGNTGTVLNPTPTQMRQLQVGMVIDVGTTASPTATMTGRTISAVNTAAGTFTFSGAAAAINASDKVFRSGAGGAGAAQQEITGLQAQIAATGILFNIDPAAHPTWASYVDDPGGATRPVTELMFMKAQQEVGIMSGEEINLWITDAGVHRNVANLLTSLKRFPSGVALHGGYSALDMSSQGQGDQGGQTVAMYYDKDCPTSTAFGLTTKRFYWFKMSDWEFMEEDGAILARIPGASGQDAYEGTLFLYAEMATDGRNAHARIGSLDGDLIMPTVPVGDDSALRKKVLADLLRARMASTPEELADRSRTFADTGRLGPVGPKIGGLTSWRSTKPEGVGTPVKPAGKGMPSKVSRK